MTFSLTAIRVTGLEYVEKGSTIQLTCNVTGKPEPPNNIDWYMGEFMSLHSRRLVVCCCCMLLMYVVVVCCWCMLLLYVVGVCCC